MPIKVTFLGELRSLAGRKDMQAALEGDKTVGDLFQYLCENLGQAFAARVFDSDGSLYDHVAVFVNGKNIRESEGLKTALTQGNVDVMILPVWDGG